ncbi:MAG: winged helix-turn-helix domain-containing protein [Nitrosomonas sp.]|nr:winged helix-turn-helix domain-containing protein [Nitrosomonas sp.]
MKNPMLEYQCLLTEAHSWLQEDNEAKALISLRKGLRIGRENDFFLPDYPWDLAVTSHLFALALWFGIEVPYVQRLIRRHHCRPHIKAGSQELEAWPWPVRIYTLGRFDVLLDGVPLRFARKAQHKPLELLKCLCAYGGHAVNLSLLTDALWPDSEGDAAEQALRTTLHRLRKLLKHARSIRMEDRYLSFDPDYVWVDSIVFDRVAHLPDVAPVSIQRALNWYRGHFLEGETACWALHFRDRLRTHYIGMTERFGDLLEQSKNWQDAATCYLKAIEAEPAAELFYRRLMVCYTRLSQRTEALFTYQRLRHALRSHLGIGPSQETLLLYQTLVAA